MYRDLNVLVFVVLAVFLPLSAAAVTLGPQDQAGSDETVSFATDVRPILAANCFGCHQGAIDRGQYVMTDFQSLVAGGETGEAAIVPGKPDESLLLSMIESHDGEAQMPPNAAPLSDQDVTHIRQWILAGAENDYTKTSANFSLTNPPTYSRPPIVTTLDVSPDGTVIAVSGFHEVLILESPSQEQLTHSQSPIAANVIRRLIGLSSRIESLKFSPDGSRLAVSGGSPGEFGEVQVWDVATGELELSKTVSFDTVYGVNWSPDGKQLSFGCTDTTVRAIDSATGEQVLFQGAHEDWVRDTVFSSDGSRLVSVGRDMSCKLIDVPTQRFIDNITSITPGVLKGGIGSVARHPTRDEIVIGGADGIPKVYRMDRLTKRKIGDDANLIRILPELPGRVQSVAVSQDGKRIAAGSSLDGNGFINVYSYEFDTGQPDNIKAIVSKVVTSQSKEEKQTLADYLTKDVQLVSGVGLDGCGVYTIDFYPDGKWLVGGGSDGLIHFIESESGKQLGTMLPVSIAPQQSTETTVQWRFDSLPENTDDVDVSPLNSSPVAALLVSPETIRFTRPTDYAQFVVQAKLEDGTVIDVTRQAKFTSSGNAITVNQSLVQAADSGTADVDIEYGGIQKSVSADVAISADAFVPDFIHDVNPVLSKLGCNAGTCHGSQGGKKGFKLSLRGYDPLYDIRSFTDDMGSRRTNLASPAASLMLMKPTGQVPHEGGKLLDREDKYYWLIHQWIDGGAQLNLSAPKVTSIELLPLNPVLLDKNWQQQMRVVATYADGSKQDVTLESVVEIGNLEIASADGSIVKAKRRGESPILARYEGAFTATTLTVMGNRESFVWEQPETWTEIDDLVAAKWQRMKIRPSELCSDEEFLRRVYLDLTGLPPTAENVSEFLADDRATRIKRDEVIDRLIGNEEFVEHWANKWADLMQVNRKYLGPDGAKGLRDWIRGQVKSNRPYDEFAYDILTASGSNLKNPAAAYFKIHRTPEEAMENTTHLFLATRFNCNKCHDHPFERWTQDQYYQTAAFFAQIDRKPDPASAGKTIGGSAVEGAKPLYEMIEDKSEGDVKHERTGEVAAPQFPFDCDFDLPTDSSRRARLAAWITSPDNPYFATSYVNRLWGYMTGVGLIEPLDDIRAGNPPSNPQLIELLRQEFIDSGFDTRHAIQLICKSRTYQLSVKTNEFNKDDTLNYSHAVARRLPAEVLFDSVHVVTGSQLKIPGVEAGMRAAALPDSGVKLPSGFLSTLGRPARESACECERANDLQLGSVLALVSGPDVSRAVGDPDSELAQIVASEPDDRNVIDQLFMRILNRHAKSAEIEIALESFGEITTDHNGLIQQRDQRKQLADQQREQLEQARHKAIASVTAELNKTIEKLDPELAAKEAKRAKAISQAETVLEEYKSDASNQLRWKRRQLEEIQWHPVLTRQFSSANETPFEIRSDRSVLLQPKAGKDVYSVTTQTDLTGVAAVRLELIAGPTLPSKGPGLAGNGNLVLTEFEIEIAHPDRPDDWKKVPIGSAMANIAQQGFSINQAFDGKDSNRQGWAIGNAIGKTSWATFQLKLPFGYSHGTLIRFKLHQSFDDTHQIGHFRISLSKYHDSIGLGLSEDWLAQLSRPEEDWSPETQQQIAAIYERDDPQLKKLQKSVADVSQPVDVDPKITKLREKLARVSEPVPPDAKLVQLESDVAMSTLQMENKRLTAAQDLAWALINSPSFLFNR